MLPTPARDIEVGISRPGKGSNFCELLELRRRIDWALWEEVMIASVTGPSTQKVEDLVKAHGCDSGVSSSAVSRICADIDEGVNEPRQRRLDGIPFVSVWLDATHLQVCENWEGESKAAVVVAPAVRGDGRLEIVAVDIGDSENEACLSEPACPH